MTSTARLSAVAAKEGASDRVRRRWPLARKRKPQATFFVCVHDVTPAWQPELEALLQDVERRIGSQYALAVTPRWHGQSFSPEAWAFLRDRGAELLAHGLTHRRPPALPPISLANRFADEWNGKPADQLDAELHQASREIEWAMGRPASGVVAPCWQWGAFHDDMLPRHGFDFAVGYGSAWTPDRKLPLATRSWDWGPMSLGHPLLSRWPGWFRWIRPQAADCIVLHPVDVRRGAHRAGLAMIDRLITTGATAVTFGEILRP